MAPATQAAHPTSTRSKGENVKRTLQRWTVSTAIIAVLLTAGWLVYSQPLLAKWRPTPKATAQYPEINRLETALGGGPAAQAPVLAPAFKGVINGQPVIPAGAHAQLQADTFRSSGNYAAVEAIVTDANHPAGYAVGVLLSRQDSASPWQIASLMPWTAKPQQTLGSTQNTSFVANRLVASGSCPDVAKGKTPVVFVHGLNEGPSAWGTNDQKTMLGAVMSLNGVQVITPFDYSSSSLHWVTDPNIGARLASTILCLAQKSGTKVVVIAHSMGGLALKEAIRERPEVTQALGLVMTIATPNDGTVIASDMLVGMAASCAVLLCEGAYNSALQLFSALPALSYGSDQVKALPDWPKSVPVYAIAGNIAPTVYTLTWSGFVGHPAGYSGSDVLVTTNSALHANIVSGLGGYREFNCVTSAVMVLPFVTHAPCDHNALLSNSDVEGAVTQQLHRYLDAQPQSKPEPAPVQAPAPSVTKTAAPTPSVNPTCSPPQGRVEQMVRQYDQAHGLKRDLQTVQSLCKKGWAVVRMKTFRAMGDPTLISVVYIVLQHVGNRWDVLASGDSSVCQRLPADVSYGMCA